MTTEEPKPKKPWVREVGRPIGMGYGMQRSHLKNAKWENVEKLAKSMHIDLELHRKRATFTDGYNEEFFRDNVREHIYRILRKAWDQRWPKRT